MACDSEDDLICYGSQPPPDWGAPGGGAHIAQVQGDSNDTAMDLDTDGAEAHEMRAHLAVKQEEEETRLPQAGQDTGSALAPVYRSMDRDVQLTWIDRVHPFENGEGRCWSSCYSVVR